MTEPTYYVLKREACNHDKAGYRAVLVQCPDDKPGCGVAHYETLCPICGKDGYTETPVDIIEVLEKLSFNYNRVTNNNNVSQLAMTNIGDKWTKE